MGLGPGTRQVYPLPVTYINRGTTCPPVQVARLIVLDDVSTPNDVDGQSDFDSLSRELRLQDVCKMTPQTPRHFMYCNRSVGIGGQRPEEGGWV